MSELLNEQKENLGDEYIYLDIDIKEKTMARIENLSKKTGYSRDELTEMLIEYAIDNFNA